MAYAQSNGVLLFFHTKQLSNHEPQKVFGLDFRHSRQHKPARDSSRRAVILPKTSPNDVKKHAGVQCLQGAEVLLFLFVLFGDRIFFERVFDLRTEVCVKLLSASKDVSHGGRMFYKVPVWQCHCFKEWCGAFLSVCWQARA